MKAAFKNEFVDEIMGIIPKDIINEFKFDVPKRKIGYIRLDNDYLNSIYLICKTGENSNYNADVLIKFKFRDFHYITPDSYWKFDKIYICIDGCNEYRYDENFELDAVYLKGVSILPNLDMNSKKHFWEVLKEWEKSDIKTYDDDEYITAYQVIKDGKETKVPYIVCNDNIKWVFNRVQEQIDKITNNFNVETCGYFCKAIIKNGKLTKKDVKYLMIKNFKDYK